MNDHPTRATLGNDPDTARPLSFTDSEGTTFDVVFEIRRLNTGENEVTMLMTDPGTDYWDTWTQLSIPLRVRPTDPDNSFMFDSRDVDPHTREWLKDSGLLEFPSHFTVILSDGCLYPEAMMTPKFYAHAFEADTPAFETLAD